MWLPCTAPSAKGKLMLSGQRLAGLTVMAPSVQSSFRALMYSTFQLADQAPRTQDRLKLARCLGMPPVTGPLPAMLVPPTSSVVVPASSWLLKPLSKAKVVTYCLVKSQSSPSLKSPADVDGNL